MVHRRIPFYLLPSSNLLLVPDAGGMRLTAGIRSDVRGLGNEERARNAGALSVELGDKVRRDVVRGVAQTCLRPEDDAVAKGDVTDLDGLEECGRGG